MLRRVLSNDPFVCLKYYKLLWFSFGFEFQVRKAMGIGEGDGDEEGQASRKLKFVIYLETRWH